MFEKCTHQGSTIKIMHFWKPTLAHRAALALTSMISPEKNSGRPGRCGRYLLLKLSHTWKGVKPQGNMTGDSHQGAVTLYGGGKKRQPHAYLTYTVQKCTGF